MICKKTTLIQFILVQILIVAYVKFSILNKTQSCDYCIIRTRLNVNYKPFKTNDEIQLETDLSHLNIKLGGKWSPVGCMPKYKLAIIIPYKNREKNLQLLLRNIHPFLVNQNTYYSIYVVEPSKNLTFNKGILMNSAFLEAEKEDDFSCFVFHDVDMVPENEMIVYNCSHRAPKLISSIISTYNYSDPYYQKLYFGGVTSFTKEQFYMVNGFSLRYYGWGAEDDDARRRVVLRYNYFEKLNQNIGRFYANPHKQEIKNKERSKLLKEALKLMDKDGLNTIKYQVEKISRKPFFTHLYIKY